MKTFKNCLFILGLHALFIPIASFAQIGLETHTFGNLSHHSFTKTLEFSNNVLRFDLSAIDPGVPIYRAVVRVPIEKLQAKNVLELVPIGLDTTPLKASEPDFQRLDILDAARQWIRDPDTNNGLEVKTNNRKIDLSKASLEITTVGHVKNPLPTISHLVAEHREGQTFITWTEVEDIIGQNNPLFEEWEEAILDSRSKRNLTYRIYGHTKPITPTTIHQAKLVREIPEALSGWNMLAIKTLEFPKGTKRSRLLPGKIEIDQRVARFAIHQGGKPLARTTGLAVLSSPQDRKYYYAISVAFDGKERLNHFKIGETTTSKIDEVEMKFPQLILLKKVAPKNPENKRLPHINIYAAWLKPPYVMQPGPTQLYFFNFPHTREKKPAQPIPLYLYLSQYGATSRVVGKPAWIGSKILMRDVYGIAFAESEDPFWAGAHQSVGTLRTESDGIVVNHGQRRILMMTQWALGQAELSLDPQRIFISGQHAIWALRHGDLFAAVGSNGYGNLRLGKESKKRLSSWGQDGMGKNWLGVPHLDYLDLADWVRKNPKKELPFWICHPSYGKFAAHTLGDLGFKPWQDFILAMQETKRAFSCVWNSNGPGELKHFVRDQLPKIHQNQSLPAFSRVSFNRSPKTTNPQGSITKKLKRVYQNKIDLDYVNYADRDGGINLYQRWETNTIVDQPDRWEMTMWLSSEAPEKVASMDITPRRLQNFKVQPGELIEWKLIGDLPQNGTLTVDKNGLITVPSIKLSQSKSRIQLEKVRQ